MSHSLSRQTYRLPSMEWLEDRCALSGLALPQPGLLQLLPSITGLGAPSVSSTTVPQTVPSALNPTSSGGTTGSSSSGLLGGVLSEIGLGGPTNGTTLLNSVGQLGRAVTSTIGLNSLASIQPSGSGLAVFLLGGTAQVGAGAGNSGIQIGVGTQTPAPPPLAPPPTGNPGLPVLGGTSAENGGQAALLVALQLPQSAAVPVVRGPTGTGAEVPVAAPEAAATPASMVTENEAPSPTTATPLPIRETDATVIGGKGLGGAEAEETPKAPVLVVASPTPVAVGDSEVAVTFWKNLGGSLTEHDASPLAPFLSLDLGTWTDTAASSLDHLKNLAGGGTMSYASWVMALAAAALAYELTQRRLRPDGLTATDDQAAL